MIDSVHHIQKAYRKLVNAFSFPGTPVQLLSQETTSGFNTNMPETILVLAMALLDSEVNASFIDIEEEDKSLIQQLTYVKLSEPKDADFIFFTKPHSRFYSMKQSIDQIKKGTLIDPHLSATILIHVNNLPMVIESEKSTQYYNESPQFVLTGPGIKTSKSLIHPDSKEDLFWWIRDRNELCKEYPLGIEVILFNSKQEVMVFPRSIKISFKSLHKSMLVWR
jgi:alpha-D-ribose 1-methylphosphonate 5-triphosphate synthase subunit PhnH